MKNACTRCLFLARCLVLATAPLPGLLSEAKARSPVPQAEPVPIAKPPAAPWKLLFSGNLDVTDAWGKLHFGVTPVRLIRECEPTAFTVVGNFPLPDGLMREHIAVAALAFLTLASAAGGPDVAAASPMGCLLFASGFSPERQAKSARRLTKTAKLPPMYSPPPRGMVEGS